MDADSRYLLNPAARAHGSASTLFTPAEFTDVANYFRSLPNYEPTPLRSASALAEHLAIAELLVKDESSRLGLKSFKIAGVSYAVDRLMRIGEISAGATLACATDGNHGRAVAHVARQRGFECHVYVHSGTSRARIDAIEREGARVTVVNGNYDDAIEQVRLDAEREGWTLLSDMAVPGHEPVSRLIMAGYTILLEEACRQWQSRPDVVLVQAGVGAFLASVATWLTSRFGDQRPRIIACEPAAAACVFGAIRAGKPVKLTGDLDTIMEGLSCGEVSPLAWPVIAESVDACVLVDDDECEAAMNALAESGIEAAPSGACGLAGLIRIRDRLSRTSRVLIFNTEASGVDFTPDADRKTYALKEDS